MKLSKFYRSSHTTLGIEITSSQIKLVEADTSLRPARILNFACIDVLSPHPDNLAQQLKAAVEGRGFKTRRANIGISHPAILHQSISLPPMPKGEMEAVIAREVKGIKPRADEGVFDWQILGEVEEKGVRKEEVLIAMAPSAVVNQTISLVEGAGLKCNRVTTIPLALLNALKLVRDGEKGAIAFLYLGMDVGVLIFSGDGRWYFSRNFPREKGGLDEQPVLSEVQRSLQYFKRHFRGEEPERIVISGEVGEDLNRIKEGLEENLGVEVEEFDPTYDLDITFLGGRIREWEVVAPRLAIPLGLVRQSPHDTLINLIPSQVKQRKKGFRRRVLVGSVAAIALLGGVAGYGRLSQSLKAHHETLRQKEVALKRLQPILEKAERLEKQRNKYNNSLAFLERLRTKRTPWLEMLQQLSIMVPNEMVFHSLEAERVKDGWQIRIKGEIIAADSFALQGSFNRFYSPFKASTLFSQIELIPLNISRFKEKEATIGQAPHEEREKSKADFEIKFQMKEER